MQIAILTFDGFNEIDSFVAVSMLNRMKPQGWSAYITSPTKTVTSMNGVEVQRQKPMSFTAEADAVLIGSGIKTRDIAADETLLALIRLNSEKQLIGAQCSGTLILAKLGLLKGLPACADLTTTPWVREAGIEVIDQPFIAHGNVATAGGCLGANYRASWFIARGADLPAAEAVLEYVAPVGEQVDWIARMRAVVTPFLD